MLEIAFDKNDNDEFLHAVRPVVTIQDEKLSSFEEYCQKAKQILATYSKEQIILIRNNSKDFSSNLFAVALFVSSCLTETKTECVVFKVSEYEKALAEYKPYVALTIALKYAIRLYNQPVADAYKEIANMAYLGIDIKRDYSDKKILMNINNGTDKVEYTSNSIDQAIVVAATLKAFALMKASKNFSAQIYQTTQNLTSDISEIINKIVKNVSEEL